MAHVFTSFSDIHPSEISEKLKPNLTGEIKLKLIVDSFFTET